MLTHPPLRQMYAKEKSLEQWKVELRLEEEDEEAAGGFQEGKTSTEAVGEGAAWQTVGGRRRNRNKNRRR